MRLLAVFLVLVSGCALNAKGIGSAGDAGPPVGDASSDTRPMPEAGLQNWCSTTGAGHDFCADFDTTLNGPEPGAWCHGVVAPADCSTHEMNGTLTLDNAVSVSRPGSANAQTTAGSGFSAAFLARDFPGDLRPLNLAFDVQIDAISSAETTIASITLEVDVGTEHRVLLVAGPRGGNVGLSLIEARLAGAPTPTALPLTLPTKNFARIEMRIDRNTVIVLVDGAASSPTRIDTIASAVGRSVRVGLFSAPADAWQLHFDNVTFDFVK